MAEKRVTLIQWLITQIDGRAYRAGTASGVRHPEAGRELLKQLGGREELILQARELERDALLGGEEKIRFDWCDLNTDIRRIHCPVEMMPVLCERAGIEDPRHRQLRYIHILEKWKDKAGDAWLTDYYKDELGKLKKGDCSQTMQNNMEDGGLYHCMNEILVLEEPVEKPVFSARIFRDAGDKEEGITPSKLFHRKYEGRVLGILKKSSPECEEGMSDDEVLAAHGILSYAQTLEWKGALSYILDDDTEISTGENIYGTMINARTLEHAAVAALPGIRRILIIENKANYEKMKYKADELYIFCHGFFSPKEVRFLRGIRDAADTEAEYYHWGDMDYGGIRIFQFNKRNVFPELKPYRMDRETYEEAVTGGAGVPLKEEKQKKLENMDAGELEELKVCILNYGLEIEQELLI